MIITRSTDSIVSASYIKMGSMLTPFELLMVLDHLEDKQDLIQPSN